MKTRITVLVLSSVCFLLGGSLLAQFDTREKLDAAGFKKAVQDLQSDNPQNIRLLLATFPDLRQLSKPEKEELVDALIKVINKYHNHPVESNLARLAIMWLPETGAEASRSSAALWNLLHDKSTQDSSKMAALGLLLSFNPGSSNYFAVLKSAVTNANVGVQTIGFQRITSRFSAEAEKEFIPFLIDVLEKQPGTNDSKVIIALGTIGSESELAAAAVRKQFSSTNAFNRAAAITSLHRMRALNDDDILLIGSFLKETEHREVRRASINVLSHIGERAQLVAKEIVLTTESTNPQRDLTVVSKAAEIIRRLKLRTE